MEKVKLTQEQAEDLEEALHAYEDDKDHMLNVFARAKDTSDWGSISHFSPSKMARALYIGYEVESYKIGDWVKVETQNGIRVSKIYAKKDNEYYLERFPGHFKSQNVLGHATDEEIDEEKERRWWHNNDRNVWELKEGDILTDGYYVYSVNNANKSIVWFEAPFNTKGYEPNHIKRKFKVVCFSERRKDIK